MASRAKLAPSWPFPKLKESLKTQNCFNFWPAVNCVKCSGDVILFFFLKSGGKSNDLKSLIILEDPILVIGFHLCLRFVLESKKKL